MPRRALLWRGAVSWGDDRFSRKPEYPYEPLPYILTLKTDPPIYRLVSPESGIVVEGDLDAVVNALVRLLAE